MKRNELKLSVLFQWGRLFPVAIDSSQLINISKSSIICNKFWFMFTPCLIVFLSSSCFLLIIFPLLPTREYIKSHHTSYEENELNSFKIKKKKTLCIYEAWGWKCRVSCHVIHTVEMSFWIDIYVYMKRFWQSDEQNQTFFSHSTITVWIVKRSIKNLRKWWWGRDRKSKNDL